METKFPNGHLKLRFFFGLKDSKIMWNYITIATENWRVVIVKINEKNYFKYFSYTLYNALYFLTICNIEFKFIPM